jgi:parvulin-like peptidyl-prolyl isomerase
VYRKVPVEEQEVRLYYNEHESEYAQTARFRVRELVVPKSGGYASMSPREVLDKVREGLDGGVPFETLVNEYSGSHSVGLGGDLGWTDKGILLPAIEDAALGLAPGEVSDVIETDIDFILIQLIASEAGGAKPFEAVREEIAMKLQEPKAHNALQLYLRSQRLRANIRYMVPREQIIKG